MFCKKRYVLVLSVFCMFLSSFGVAGETPALKQVDWPYPKRDCNNTSTIAYEFPSALSKPQIKWTVETTGPDFFEGWWGSYVTIADLDDDRQLELLVAQGRGFNGPQRLVCLSIRNGTKEWEFTLAAQERIQWASPNVVDVDGDGTLEVVLGSGPRVLVLDGKTGTVEWERSFPQPMCLGVAELSPQGRPDIIVNSYKDPKKCYRLDGRSGEQQWEFITHGSAYNVPAIADINNDGRAEILFHVHRYNPSRETEFCLTADGKELWHYDASPSKAQNAKAPPELGWVPDFGYISTITGDFLANGERQVFFATRCHTYLLSSRGDLIWRHPLAKGFGVFLIKDANGNIEADIHGTGGSEDHAAGGDLNDDGALDIVMGLDAEYRGIYDRAKREITYERVDGNNRVIALDGKTGKLIWAFEGEYPGENSLERMRQPILLDLDADGKLDVVVVSTDGNLYGLKGTDGRMFWRYPLGSSNAQLMGACVVDQKAILIVITTDYSNNKGKVIAFELKP